MVEEFEVTQKMIDKQDRMIKKKRKKLYKELKPKFDKASLAHLISIEPNLRGQTAMTKNIEVQMKSNLAYWAMDASQDCLYGYVAGKIDEAFYMEEDKFEAIYELAWVITEAISPWFEKGGFSTWDFNEEIESDVEVKFKTKNFKGIAWYCQGLNDFSVNIKRRKKK